MNTAPPPRPPKPGQVSVVRALYKYTAQYPDELSFEEGDILYIVDVDSSDPNWFRAKCGTSVGLIPRNYVEESAEVVDNPLHDAAKRGNVDFLLSCLQSGVSVNSLDKAGNTPLYWASHAGHTDCMSKLLQCPSVEINVRNKLGDTPVHAAAWKGHTDAVSLLLQYGADTNITNNQNLIPAKLARDPDVLTVLGRSRQSATQNVIDYIGDENDEDSD